MLNVNRKEHAEAQRKYFDQRFEFFKQPIPAEIQERTRQIIATARLTATSRVLDVGTGMGVLIEHFMDEGALESNIVGCDLSAKMLDEARRRYRQASFWQGDILDFPDTFGKFDAIVFNACFGNIYDQTAAINKSVTALKDLGRIIISHPLGAGFVHKLHTDEPEIVPHLLPGKNTLKRWSRNLGLTLEIHIDENELYLAVLKKARQFA